MQCIVCMMKIRLICNVCMYDDQVPPRVVMDIMIEHGMDASLDCLAFGLVAAIGRKRG